MPAHRGKRLRGEDLRDQSNLFMHAHCAPIRDSDPGCLLPAVLQGVKPKKGHTRDIFIGGKDTNNAALFVRTVLNLLVMVSFFKFLLHQVSIIRTDLSACFCW